MNIHAGNTLVLDALLAKPYRLTIIASGAGAGIQSTLWNRAGTSNFLTGAYFHFPYDRRATSDLLGFEPEKSVSRKTAIQMAVEAYIRSCRGTGTGEPLGLGLTAAVSTSRDRKGANTVDAAIITKTEAYLIHVNISKDLGGMTPEAKRVHDGVVADDVGMGLIGQALGVRSLIGAELIPEQELRDIIYENPLFLPNGKRPANWQEMMTTITSIVPTSANPPHEGHFGMIEEMEYGYNGSAIFAITADSVHKPSLSAQELLQRVSYFRDENTSVLVTRNDPLFIDKARQFPGKIFGIGVDTLERMLDPKWSTQPIEEMLAEFVRYDVKFCVFDRNGKDMFSIIDMVLPPHNKYRSLFERNPKNWNISSSQIRAITARAAAL